MLVVHSSYFMSTMKRCGKTTRESGGALSRAYFSGKAKTLVRRMDLMAGS